MPDSERKRCRITIGTLLSKQFMLQNRTAPLLKVESSISERFLKRSQLSLNTFIGVKHATDLVLVNDLFKSKGRVANCMTDRASIYTGNAEEHILHCINSCSHCYRAIFETERSGAKTCPVQCEDVLTHNVHLYEIFIFF